MTAHSFPESMKRILPVFLFLLAACGEKTPTATALAEPTGVSAVLLEDQTSARLTWNAVTGAVSYYVFLRESTQGYYIDPVASVAASPLAYTFTGLTPGKSYYCGVQAMGKTVKELSRIVYSDLLTVPKEEEPVVPDPPVGPDPPVIPDPGDKPSFEIVSNYATSAYIGIRYKIGNAGTNIPHGICFAEHAEPTTEDAVIAGPALGDKTDLLQLIPSTMLAYGKTYHVRPYATVTSGTYYGPDTELTLTAEPAAIQLTWNKVSTPGLDAGIEVYETTSTLSGRAFHAWYAIADCTGGIELRVQYPSAKATVENQFGDDCQVLINGSVFGGSGKSIAMAITDGTRSAWRAEADGQYWGAGKLLPVTRATFGVDASGHPATCWSGYPDASYCWFYDRPLTTVAGEAAFSACTASHPAPALDWLPKNAIAGGPMLLHGGICPTDLTKSPTGYYMTNYELWADDIFGSCPDRTAVGYTADGKVVLFVCDGRIAASKGAYVTEVAQMLRGIGCVGAINLDGGDSTAMVVRGTGRINDSTGGSRAVCTTLGFFKRP